MVSGIEACAAWERKVGSRESTWYLPSNKAVLALDHPRRKVAPMYVDDRTKLSLLDRLSGSSVSFALNVLD